MIRTFVHDSGAVLIHLAISPLAWEDIRLAVMGYSAKMPPSVMWDFSSARLPMNPAILASTMVEDVLPQSTRVGGHLRVAVVAPNRKVAALLEDAFSEIEAELGLAVFVERDAALEWLNSDDLTDAPHFAALEGVRIELDGKSWTIDRLERRNRQTIAVLKPFDSAGGAQDAGEAQDAGGAQRRPLVEVLERIAHPVEMSLPEIC